MDPVLLAALINRFAVPELGRWLAQLHSEGKVVDEAAARAKLGLDVEEGDSLGLAFLATHPAVR